MLSGRVTEENVLAVAAFYLVAAVVGLFRRLGTASERETGGEEDWTSMATGDPAFWLKD